MHLFPNVLGLGRQPFHKKHSNIGLEYMQTIRKTRFLLHILTYLAGTCFHRAYDIAISSFLEDLALVRARNKLLCVVD